MKKFLLVAASLATFLPAARADEVALMTIKIGREKPARQVAIEFYEAEAPKTVENFKKLAGKRFYKGIAFHRAFPHTLVQAGDPLTRRKDRTKAGTNGPGYTVIPEIRRKHTAGAVAMARLPDKINPSRLSNGSQFFICLKPMPEYDGQYTVFGHVLWGMETLDLISTKPVDSNDYPIERIVIKSVKIVPREKMPAPPAAAAPGPPRKKRWWQIF